MLDKTAQAVPMERKDAVHLLSQHDMIVFAYPVQFSNIPAMVRDFIKSNRNLWKNKKVLCVATMLDGAGFIQKLWDDANSHFEEVAHLAKKDENGNIRGIWGAMSDFSRSFQPWKEFHQGLYLAGVECNDDAEAPDGWIKWVIPGYEYIYVECEHDGIFPEVIQYMKENDIPLAGAVHDFTCPQTGKSYMFFPIRKL